jgi:hypothetical protein
MQKGSTTRPLAAEIFSDCGRIKAGKNWLEFYEWPLFSMIVSGILLLVFQKGLKQLDLM